MIPASVVESLKLTEEQSRELAAIEEHVKAEVAKIFTPEQKERLEEMRNPQPGRFAFGPPGDGAGPRRDGPPGGDGGPDGRARQPRGPGGFGPPGGGPGGPPGFGGPGGGPGGIFRSYRYGPDHPALAGKELEPGRKLDEVANETRRRGPRDGGASRKDGTETDGPARDAPGERKDAPDEK